MELYFVKKKKKMPMWFMRLSYQEGISMIESLSNQLHTENLNSGRTEYYTNDGTYVSISVLPDLRVGKLQSEIMELKEELRNKFLRSWSKVPKERKKTNQKGVKHGKS